MFAFLSGRNLLLSGKHTLSYLRASSQGKTDESYTARIQMSIPQAARFPFHRLMPNSSGIKRGQTFSVDAMTDAASVEPISIASSMRLP